jgi:hypothetical protein
MVCKEGRRRPLLCRRTALQAIGMTMFQYIHRQVLRLHHLSILLKRIPIPFPANHLNLPHATEAFGCLTRPCQISPRCSNRNSSNQRPLTHLPLANQPHFHPFLHQRTILLNRLLLIIRHQRQPILGQTRKRQQLVNRSSIVGHRCQRCADQIWSSVQVRLAWHHESRHRQINRISIYLLNRTTKKTIPTTTTIKHAFTTWCLLNIPSPSPSSARLRHRSSCNPFQSKHLYHW